MRQLCHRLPKAELHAHLHGCARLSTIAELAPKGVDTSSCLIPDDDDRSLEACFAIFGTIHKTVTNLAAVRRICREVLEDFAADNVRYLELRSTPRALDDADAEGYVRAVLSEFAAHEARCPAMTVRLLLSIDRTGGLDKAIETVMLAARLKAEAFGDDGSAAAGAGRYIVGVDFSGNPTRGSFADFLPAFRLARDQCGLRIAVHAGEVDNPFDTQSILAFGPDRLGHALLLSADDLAALREAPIPIELCPTSNKMTLHISSMRQHPTMAKLIRSNYPASISTDDSSVFGTTPSNELRLCAEACDLTYAEVVALAAAPLSHAFLDETADPSASLAALQADFARESAQAMHSLGLL